MDAALQPGRPAGNTVSMPTMTVSASSTIWVGPRPSSSGRPARCVATAMAGIVRPMLAIADPRARLRLICDPVAPGGLDRGQRLRQQDQQRDDDADERGRQADGGDRRPDRRRATLASPTTATSETSSRPRLAQRARRSAAWRGPRPRCRAARRACRPGGRSRGGGRSGSGRTGRRGPARPRPRRSSCEVGTPGRLAGREGRQHEATVARVATRGQRPAGALLVEQRDTVPQRADQQREAQDPVDGDHHGGEHGVAGQGRGLPAAGPSASR